MLIDLNINMSELGGLCRRLDVGIYETRLSDAINRDTAPLHMLDSKLEHELGDASLREKIKWLPKDEVGCLLTFYGSCDSLEQLREHSTFKWAATAERPIVLIVFTITRETDPGWRWHKNGPYIGTREPRAEHFGDEPEIDSIVVFCFFAVTYPSGGV